MGDWTCCQEGSVKNPGTLSFTSRTNCVGQGVDTPYPLAVEMNAGKACQLITYDCETSVTFIADVPYGYEVKFTPPITNTFTDAGVHPFTVSVCGASWEDWVCPTNTAPATVGTFTVYTVGVGSLQSDQGCDNNGLTNIVDWADSGVVTVTATPNPNIPANNLPSCWNMYGDGTQVSRTVRTVPKSSPGFYRIVAQAGTSAKTQVVVVVKCSFTAFAREGPGCCGITNNYGHGWWKLGLEPSGAKVLLGGNPSDGPQAFVNRELGWACRDCLSSNYCTDTGRPMLDSENRAGGPPTDSHVWQINFIQLQQAATFSSDQEGSEGYYDCGFLGWGAYNCVTLTRSAGQPAGVVIPTFSPTWPWCAYDCPHEFAYWLASLL